MPRFLVDVNLPYRFSLWAGEDYVHIRDIGETWTDSQIWRYAREQDLVIVSKDADFSDRIMISSPSPRIVHIRFGNLRIQDFHGLLSRVWPLVVELSELNKLVRVYQDRIETVE